MSYLERLVAEVRLVRLVSVRACRLVSCGLVEESHFVGEHIEMAPMLAGRLVLPRVLAKPCRHTDEATFGEVASARLGKLSDVCCALTGSTMVSSLPWSTTTGQSTAVMSSSMSKPNSVFSERATAASCAGSSRSAKRPCSVAASSVSAS